MVFFANSANGLGLSEALADRIVGGVHTVFKSGIMDGYARFDSPEMDFVHSVRQGDIMDSTEKIREMVRANPDEAPPLNENFINGLGYRMLGSEHVEDAIQIFQLNVDLYPESSNVYDSLGEGYMLHGDTTQAISNYEQSLALNPENANAVAMLERLRNNK